MTLTKEERAVFFTAGLRRHVTARDKTKYTVQTDARVVSFARAVFRRLLELTPNERPQLSLRVETLIITYTSGVNVQLFLDDEDVSVRCEVNIDMAYLEDADGNVLTPDACATTIAYCHEHGTFPPT